MGHKRPADLDAAFLERPRTTSGEPEKMSHRKDYEEGRISYDEYLMLEKLSRSDPAEYRRRERSFRTRGWGPGRVVYPVADEKMNIDEILAEPDPEPRV